MGSILNVFTALSNLARAFNRLAALTDGVSDQVERKVEAIETGPGTPVIENHSGAGNGKRTRAAV